jgi:hypothetical protein
MARRTTTSKRGTVKKTTKKFTTKSRTTKKKTTSRTKKTISRKTTRKTTKRTTKKGTTKKKAEEQFDAADALVTGEELVTEISKLLSLGVPKENVRDILIESGLNRDESDELIGMAMETYHGGGKVEEIEIPHYETNSWLLITTIVVLAILVVIGIWLMLKGFQVI